MDSSSAAASSSRDNINYRSFSSSLLDQIYRSMDELQQQEGPSSYKSPHEDDHEDQPRIRAAAACLMQPATVVGRRSSAERSSSRRLRRSYEEEEEQGEVFNGLNSISSTENIKREKQRIMIYHRHEEENESKGKKSKGKSSSSKSAAALALKKIYSDLKQPISPGGRLASFLNSLFTTGTGNQKNPKNTTNNDNEISPQQLLDRIKSKSTANASSATAFSRSSCSSSNTTITHPSDNCRVGRTNIGILKRSGRFYPRHKLYSTSSHDHQQQQHMINNNNNKEEEEEVIKSHDSNRLRQAAARRNVFKPECNYLSTRKHRTTEYHHHVNHFHDEDDGSDSSSDLFELDHLSIVDDRYRQELPVYKTTQLHTDELFQ